MHARGIRKRTDGYDPGESRILLNIARALNFLPIKPPASLPVLSSSSFARSLAFIQTASLICNPFPRPHPPSNLIQSLPAWFPGRIGYSVTEHEHRLISIPATQLPSFPSPSATLYPLPRILCFRSSLPRTSPSSTIETSTDPRRCRATCGKSLAESPDSARFKSLLRASSSLLFALRHFPLRSSFLFLSRLLWLLALS